MKLNPGDEFNPYPMPWARRAVRANSRLSAGARLAFEALVDRAGEDGRCWPSVGTLAGDIGVQHRQAQRFIRELTKGGFCRVEPAYDGTNRQMSNRFVFLWRPEYEREGGVTNKTPLSNVTPSGASGTTSGRTSAATPKCSPIERTPMKLAEPFVEFVHNQLKDVQLGGFVDGRGNRLRDGTRPDSRTIRAIANILRDRAVWEQFATRLKDRLRNDSSIGWGVVVLMAKDVSAAHSGNRGAA